MAGGQADRPATRNVQINTAFMASLDVKTALDVASLTGIKDSHFDRSPRTLDGGSVGRDAGCPGVRVC